MELSIIIVSWNTRDLLRRCLDSVEQTVGELSHEVIVVDNGSLDGSVELVADRYPQVKLIANAQNRGFAGANNQALGVAQGRYVLLLNSDAELLAGTLRKLVDCLATRPDVGAVGAQVLNPDGSFQWSYADFPTLVGELLLLAKLARFVHSPRFPSHTAAQSQVGREVDWVLGACLLVRRAAISAVGGLDEDYFMYTEETDWCYRLTRAGWKVYYEPGAKVLHWSGQSAAKVPEQRRKQLYQSKLRYLQKHRGRRAAMVFRVALQASSALKLLLWSSRGHLSLHRGTRVLARQHARSYAVLLQER